MIKTIAATTLALLLSAGSLAYADDAPPPATPENELNLLLVSNALISYCKIAVDPAVAAKMSADVTALETQLGIDGAAVKAATDAITSNVTSTKPDCSPTNDVVVAVQGMLKAYAAQ